MSCYSTRHRLFTSRRSADNLNETETSSPRPIAVGFFKTEECMGLQFVEYPSEPSEPLKVSVKDEEHPATLSPAGSVDSGVSMDYDAQTSPNEFGVRRARSFSETGDRPIKSILKRSAPGLRSKTFSEGDEPPFRPIVEWDAFCESLDSLDEESDGNKSPKRVTFSERIATVRTFKTNSSISANAKKNEKKRRQKQRKELERQNSQQSESESDGGPLSSSEEKRASASEQSIDGRSSNPGAEPSAQLPKLIFPGDAY